MDFDFAHTAKINICLGVSCGLAVGFLIYSFLTYETPTLMPIHGIYKKSLPTYKESIFPLEEDYGQLSDGENFNQKLDEKIKKNVTQVSFEDSHFHKDKRIANDLEKKIRILCWIMTSPQNLNKKAIHVKRTWAKRCTVLLFMSSRTNTSFPTIGLNVAEGREHLTAKTMQAFRYVYENHFNDADWFMKADDDTYVILENLRFFLMSYSKDDPVFFGHRYKKHVKQGYNSGGAGYVLSKEALRRFSIGIKVPLLCREDGGFEDVEIGKCMQILGVRTMRTTDALGRNRFNWHSPDSYFSGAFLDTLYKFGANGTIKGKGGISDYTISFHYVPPQQMYALEFYIYHLKPYGIMSGNADINVQDRTKTVSGIPHKISSFYFCFGLVVGLLLGFALLIINPFIRVAVFKPDRDHLLQVTKQDSQKHFTDAHSKQKGIGRSAHDKDSPIHQDNSEIAEVLETKIRILCLVMTSEEYLNRRAMHVKQTWAKRCNSALFFSSSTTNSSFQTVRLHTPEGTEHLTAKTIEAFRYVYDNHFNEADWFLKVDDDTFVILENLRYFLSSYSSDDPVYFGHLFKSIVNQGFYCGKAGYVLSKEALRRLGLGGDDPDNCMDGEVVDVELGKCMEALGVKTSYSNDVLGRTRFHCFDAEKHLIGNFPQWYYNYDTGGAQKGTKSISDYAISFNVATPVKINMHTMEFYIYHLRPYGIKSELQSINIPAGVE